MKPNKITLASLLAILGINFLIAQNLDENQIKAANEYLKTMHEVYFRFGTNPDMDIEQISKTISICRLDESYVYAFANEKQFNNFLGLGIYFEALVPPSLQYAQTSSLKSATAASASWTEYPTYEEYVAMMEKFAADYPDLCQLHEIGESLYSRKILALKISDNVAQKEAEPEFMYSSSMHGNETGGYILMLRLIDYMLKNYHTNPRIKHLIDNIEIWINPLANPDGTYVGDNSTVQGAMRSNGNYLDLNRNYPDPEDGQHPDDKDWQLENIHMMNFMKQHQFVMSANFHSGEVVLNYPWDTWQKRHIDDAWFQHICRQYADTAQELSGNTYMTAFDNGITNGYDWYSISGGRQDYVTYFLHGREVTIELSYQYVSDSADLARLWEYNLPSMLNYMEQSLFGISGIVSDSLSGKPINAKIVVENHDDDMSYVLSHPENGNYHRLIAAGTYDITVSAEKYVTKTIKNVKVGWDSTTVADVRLKFANFLDTLYKQTFIGDSLKQSQTVADTLILDYNILDTVAVSYRFGDTLHFDTTFVVYVRSDIKIYDTTTVTTHVVGNLVLDTAIREISSIDTSVLEFRSDTSEIDKIIVDTYYGYFHDEDTIDIQLTHVKVKIFDPETSVCENIEENIEIAQQKGGFAIITPASWQNQQMKIEIYDIVGNKVYQNNHQTVGGIPVEIAYGEFKKGSGIFLLRLNVNKEYITRKFFVQ